MVNLVKFEGSDHYFFAGSTDPEYINLLTRELATGGGVADGNYNTESVVITSSKSVFADDSALSLSTSSYIAIFAVLFNFLFH